jgi:cellobiose-specific phosphotransferase system component IIB
MVVYSHAKPTIHDYIDQVLPLLYPKLHIKTVLGLARYTERTQYLEVISLLAYGRLTGQSILHQADELL